MGDGAWLLRPYVNGYPQMSVIPFALRFHLPANVSTIATKLDHRPEETPDSVSTLPPTPTFERRSPNEVAQCPGWIGRAYKKWTVVVGAAEAKLRLHCKGSPSGGSTRFSCFPLRAVIGAACDGSCDSHFSLGRSGMVTGLGERASGGAC